MAIVPLQDVLDRKYLPTLDGLRAISVVLVIAGHSGVAMPADLGVSAFFVLSGFLIVGSPGTELEFAL